MNAPHELIMKNGRAPALQASTESRAMLHSFVDLLCDHMESSANLFDLIRGIDKVAAEMARDGVPGFEHAYGTFIAQWFADQPAKG